MIFHAFCRLLIFFKINFFAKILFRITIRVSKTLYPNQDRHTVGPDLGPNCLQKLSEDNTTVLYVICLDFQEISSATFTLIFGKKGSQFESWRDNFSNSFCSVFTSLREMGLSFVIRHMRLPRTNVLELAATSWRIKR